MTTLKRIHESILKALGSKRLLYLIVALFALQALWVALSFRFPMIFDEHYHFSLIDIHSQQWSPFITEQPTAYDQFGNLTTGAHGIYHYILSFPYRVLKWAGLDTAYTIIILRSFNILMVCGGLLLYSKILGKIGVKQTSINIGLFFFTLLPIVTLLSAHINYDNLLFLLTPLYLNFAINIIKTKKVVWTNFAYLIITGLFASMVKYTFLPILTLTIIYLAIFVYRKFGTSIFMLIKQSYKKEHQKRILQRTIVVGLVVVTTISFSATVLKNIVVYKKPNPSCTVSLSLDRCLKRGIEQRNRNARATKDEREMDPIAFTIKWYQHMTHLGNTSSSTTGGVNESSFPSRILKALMVFGPIVGIGGLLYAWRSIRKEQSWGFLILVSVGLISSVYYVNLSGYMNNHIAFANQARYLLSVIPIIIVMSVVSYSFIMRHYIWAKYVALSAALVIFSQGGGVITHISRSKETWYWQKKTIIETNHRLQNLVDYWQKD